MLYRVTIGLAEHDSTDWLAALARGYERAQPEAEIKVILREDGVLCAIASFDHTDPYVAGELARGWFIEAGERAGLRDDAPLASFDVLAVVDEA